MKCNPKSGPVVTFLSGDIITCEGESFKVGEPFKLTTLTPCPPPANLRTVPEGAVVIEREEFEKLRKICVRESGYSAVAAFNSLFAAHPAPEPKNRENEAERIEEEIRTHVDRFGNMENRVNALIAAIAEQLAAIKEGGVIAYNPNDEVMRQHIEEFACAYSKHTHLLPHEAVMRIEKWWDGTKEHQRVWFEAKERGA